MSRIGRVQEKKPLDKSAELVKFETRRKDLLFRIEALNSILNNANGMTELTKKIAKETKLELNRLKKRLQETDESIKGLERI